MLFDWLDYCAGGNRELVAKILWTLIKLTNFASNFVFVIVWNIAKIIGGPGSTTEAITASFDASRSAVRRYYCSPYSALVFRSCLAVIDNPLYKCKALSALSPCASACRAGSTGTTMF
jgi:hypothetical protein